MPLHNRICGLAIVHCMWLGTNSAASARKMWPGAMVLYGSWPTGEVVIMGRLAKVSEESCSTRPSSLAGSIGDLHSDTDANPQRTTSVPQTCGALSEVPQLFAPSSGCPGQRHNCETPHMTAAPTTLRWQRSCRCAGASQQPGYKRPWKRQEPSLGQASPPSRGGSQNPPPYKRMAVGETELVCDAHCALPCTFCFVLKAHSGVNTSCG